MFLTIFNGYVEFAICLGIPSNEGLYHMETSLLMCNTNPWTGFCMVDDFSGGYSQRDCNFNFNINVNVTVDCMNSSFNFSFSLAFRIMKLESMSKITTQFETVPQCLLFFALFFYIY